MAQEPHASLAPLSFLGHFLAEHKTARFRPSENPTRKLTPGAPEGEPSVGWGILGQAGADCAPSLSAPLDAFGVAPEMSLHTLAEQIVSGAKCQNKLQLSLSFLQLLIASLKSRGHTSIFSNLFDAITPLGKGAQTQGTKGRQRDLLPLPLPAFGALLNLVKKLKRPGSGVIIWEGSSRGPEALQTAA